MSKQIKFSPDDEEFFGSVGSFGVPKFDNAMNGGVPRGFLVVGFTETGSGSELFAKQLTSPAEEHTLKFTVEYCSSQFPRIQ